MQANKKVKDGGKVVCMECGKVFYANKQRMFCDECQKERVRARSKKRMAMLKEQRKQKSLCSDKFHSKILQKGYESPEERFGVSSETGKIYRFAHDVEEYNHLHGTRLSYGRYESMLNFIKEKRLKEIRAKNALKIGAILQSQGASPKEVEKAYDSLNERGKK